MNIKNFVSKHGATILSGTACVGVGATGFFSAKLGMCIEAEKENLKSEDRDIKNKSIKRIILKALPSVGTVLITIVCIIMSRYMSKKELAELAAAMAVQVKLFKEYRAHEDPERDKQIMEDIAIENVDTEKISEEDHQNGEEYWTDDYIKKLSKGKIDGYWAYEADILRAAMYMKDTYYNYFSTDIGVFYSVLRDDCGVDIPKFIGESQIVWEQSSERGDYQGNMALDFNWSSREVNGKKINSLYWSETEHEIAQANDSLTKWFKEAKDRQDAIDAYDKYEYTLN